MTEQFSPAYPDLLRSGELEERAGRAFERLRRCHHCARRRHVNRLLSTKGAFCPAGEEAVAYGSGARFGEEKPLAGRGGSGTIFFSLCNLARVFCRNRDISREGDGREVSREQLVGMRLEMQKGGCRNINLVTTSRPVPRILATWSSVPTVSPAGAC